MFTIGDIVVIIVLLPPLPPITVEVLPPAKQYAIEE
jgi:hypothetical protein